MLFAQKLAAGYESAGFKRSRSNATRLRANESVRQRVAEIQAAGANSAEGTVARLLAELDARAKATSLNQLPAAVWATAEKARDYWLNKHRSK
jgi:methionine salvage enolase-phosphatase E1